MKLGWHKDDPDERDHIFAAPETLVAGLPKSIDLSNSPFEAPVTDQRPLSSCSAHAISAMFHFINAKEKRASLLPSRLFIYYNERRIEHTVARDAGARIRNGIKSVAKAGVCDESEWPYVTANFADLPPDSCYASALEHRAIEYLRNGVAAEQRVGRSGHRPRAAFFDIRRMAAGYDDTSETFLVRNSCGDAWDAKATSHFPLPLWNRAISPMTSGRFAPSPRTMAAAAARRARCRAPCRPQDCSPPGSR